MVCRPAARIVCSAAVFFSLAMLARGLARAPAVQAAQGAQATRALAPTTLYVAPPPAGNDDRNDCTLPGNPCATVQHAVDAAQPGDAIRIAGGYYSRAGTVATIAKPLQIEGGYDGAFTAPDPDLHPTVLDAQRAGPVIYIDAEGDVTLTCLTVTRGDGTGLCDTNGCGGGIYAHRAALHVGRCVITDNVGSHSGSGLGGGLFVWGATVEVWASRIVSNTATTEPSPPATGRGGGAHITMGGAVFRENEILNNLGSVATSGAGGGLYINYLGRCDVLSNTICGNKGSLSNWRSDGGGVWVDHSSFVRVAGNLIDGNWTSGHPSEGSGLGGGVYVWDADANVEGNTIVNNSAGTYLAAFRPGGGVCIQSAKPVTLSNNLIAHNSGGTWDGGGVSVGLSWAPPSSALLVNNTIVGNGGSGVVGWQYAVVTLTNNLISGHDMGLFFQVPLTGSAMTADTNLLWNRSEPIVGSHAILKNPLLTANYHLRKGSPALNAGLTVPWLTTDLEGRPRPPGAYDIGAFEGVWQDAYLPVVKRSLQ